MNAIPIKWLEQQVNSKDTKLAVAAWRVLEAWQREKVLVSMSPYSGGAIEIRARKGWRFTGEGEQT